jgi:hypothetical protein
VSADVRTDVGLDLGHRTMRLGAYNALLLSFTASASTYTSLPIFLNRSDISAMPVCCSLSVAA